jgi:hypothetical protein
VLSGHGDSVFYRVSYLKVQWQDGVSRDAFCVFIQYGNEHDFVMAKKKKQIRFTRPAHILPDDLNAVTSAIEEIKFRQKY